MKIWDIGGQFQYRQNWVDYAKMGDVIIFMVDGSNVRNLLLILFYFNICSMTQFQLLKKNYILY